MADPVDFGAVYGSGVDNAQKTLNLQALNNAAAAGVEVLLTGQLYVNGPVTCFENLDNAAISLRGESMLATGLWYSSAVSIEHFVSLEGTRYFQMENLTISGGNTADYGLYCGRNVALDTAGKHSFQNVRVIDCVKASHLNYGSEENTYIKCQFQRSPIGAIITGYPVNANVAVVDANPIDDWGGFWTWSTSHFFYDCAFGDAGYASRCGLMVIRSVIYLFGGIIQAKQDDSEAYAIIDGTNSIAVLHGVHFDSGLSPIALKFGYYAPTSTLYANRVSVIGCHLTVNAAGEHYIVAKNLRNSNFGPISVAGPVCDFYLENTSCFNNEFVNCRFTSGEEITVNLVGVL